MLPEPLPDVGNRTTQWVRFKKQFKYFLESTEKVYAPDKVKTAKLLRTVGEKGNNIYENVTFTTERSQGR